MKNIMKRREKIELIEDIVRSPFKREKYLEFLEVIGGEVFRNTAAEEKAGEEKRNSKTDELVGEIITEKNYKTGLFIVKYENLNPTSDKRRIQRSYIANLLKNTHKEYTRALVAFYSPAEELWRLSLIERDDAFKSGEIIPFKMNSHIMGCDKRCGATLEMILQILEKPKKKGKQGIDLVFDKEKLLEGFFKTFSEKFIDLKERLQNNKDLISFIDRENIERDDAIDELSKRMITQFIVLYFIEKKGWLGADKNNKLENGDKNFIINFYKSCTKGEIDFYDGCLKPLFYEGFSKYRGQEDYMERFDCKIPYFNIELFKPNLDIIDKKKMPVIKIKNDFFYNNGEGILEFFDKYYFSFMENEPNLRDMVVDPEMLGEVFENLLDVNYRKSKGTYYTPREIVHFMCKKNLINYLYNHTNNITQEEIRDFVFLLEFYWDEDKNYLRKFKSRNSKELKLPTNIYNNLDKIEESLKSIKVIEPSVGSGAFLLGMLGELFKIRKIIMRYKSVYNELEKDHERKKFFSNENYELKAAIIEDNLFGIDLDPVAVETSKLRLWLSLMAESEEKNLEDLMKYNENIFHGNAITTDWDEKFSSRASEGFDIVIGNPPYVGEKGNKGIFREIMGSPLGKRYYKGKGDLFYFFFHLGLDLLKDRGTLAYITTNYYVTADGAVNLREDIKKRSNILQMIDFNEINIFSKAKGQHNIITVLEKSEKKDRKGETALCEKTGELSSLAMSRYLAGRYEYGNYAVLDQSEFYRGDKNYIQLEKNTISFILEKVLTYSVPLKSQVNINQGLVSGADKVTPRHLEKFGVEGEKGEGIFSLSLSKVDELGLTSKEKKSLGMFFKNSHIDRYICEEIADSKIIYVTKEDDIEELPNISEHLKRFKSVLENKRETRQGKLPWYSLHWPREKSIFLGEKVVAPQRSKKNVFAYTTTEWYASADVYYITPRDDTKISLKYITALLNSKLYYVWLYKRGKRKGELLELYATPLEELPVKVLERSEQNIFEKLVDEIILLKKREESTKNIEEKIDDMVCDIYELTKAERDEIYSFYRGKQG